MSSFVERGTASTAPAFVPLYAGIRVGGAAVWERMDGGGLTFGLVSGMEGQRRSLNHMAVHLPSNQAPVGLSAVGFTPWPVSV